jgi:transposase-like protein
MTCFKCQHSTVKKFGRYGRHRIQRYRCTSCSTTFSDAAPTTTLAVRVDEALAMRAIHCLLEGCSVRSAERLTGLHRDTILELLVLAGKRCSQMMDARMRNLQCRFVESDEIWAFLGKKQKRVRKDDSPELGDAWVFVAIDADTKLIPSSP